MPCILVIDPDEASLRLAQKLLNGHGFEVLTARDHFDGFLAVQRTLVDLILIDLATPRIDGGIFIRSLEDDLNYRQIPIVAFTTWDEEQAEMYQSEYGFSGFIGKPMNTRSFVSTVIALMKIHTRV